MPTRRALTTRGLDLELAFDDVPDLVLGVVAAVLSPIGDLCEAPPAAPASVHR